MKNRNSGHLSASTKRTFVLLSISLMNLLEEKPFEKITTIDICKNANIPRATFYNHFEDKYDLLRYTLECISEQIKANINETENDKEYITQFFCNLLSSYETNIKFFRQVGSANYNSVLHSEIKKLIRNILIERMTQNVLNGISYPADIKIVAEFYANGIVFTVQSWIDNGMKTPKAELIKSLVEIVTN